MKKEQIKEIKLPLGMCCQYGLALEEFTKRYILENKGTKTPILKNLKGLLEAFEYQALGGIGSMSIYIFYKLELEVDNLKIYFFKYDLSEKKISQTSKGSCVFTLQEFNKNWINFLQELNIFVNLDVSFEERELIFNKEYLENQMKEIKETIK